MKIDIKLVSKGAINILKVLHKNGYEAYIVGGAVRDLLLNITPYDYDITTNAKPDEVIKCFNKTIPTGIKYGTITVVMEDDIYEVTTYRLECDYDGRRPRIINYANTLKEDLSRRDFTINAIALDIKGNIIDYFNSQRDLKLKKINCVGNTNKRLKEDRLRILRAIRFASKYNFNINQDILNSIKKNNNISQLSKERIREEFNKILLSQTPSTWLNMMYQLGLLQQIIPELCNCYKFNQYNIHHDKNVFDHILAVVDNIEPKLELRLSALFHDIGKPQTFSFDDKKEGHFYLHHKESAKICRDIMKRFKYSNKEIEYVSELVYWHMSKINTFQRKTIKKFINNVGINKLDDLFKLQIADILGSKTPDNYKSVYKLKLKCEEILSTVPPMSIKNLQINGYDLMELDFKGKEIGNCLKYLLEIVLEDESKNDKEILINIAKKYKEG